jgi:CheY-like chemotaxis protein
LELFVTISPEVPKHVIGDELRIVQVLNNLLSNATKFTSVGKIAVEVVKTAQMENKAELFFLVTDTGVGIAKENLDKLFKSFSQVDASISRKYGGTGLGLFITKYVVELMGGTISVNSEVGEGSEFIVELALQEVDLTDNNIVSPEKLLDDDFNSILNGKRVLLCEDNEMNSQIAVRVLEKKGMIVECAPDGQAGLEKFNNSDEGYYDVVLMDVRMPVMDGLEATKFIRNLERMDSKKVPIIAMSANTHKKDIEAALNAGMSTHIGKPFDIKELYKIISLELVKE